ncbi:MAG: hypothetical protein IT244_00315 [Bacteroidia bacterium]|nr:hypothetical protein [Bacteroidia bacterium]
MVKFLHLFNSMWFRSIILWIGLFYLPVLKAQQFVSPGNVSTGITVAVEIKSAKDLLYVKNNINRFYGVQRVRVNGDVNISQVAAVLELLDDLQDVQLLKFSGELTENDLLKLEWVENVTLYLRNGKEDQILMNDNLGSLNGLTLIFEVVPEDYYFIETLKKIKSLTLIAPFVTKEAATAIAKARQLTQLKHFGISLDKIADLSESVRDFPKLESITVIDNLSFITEKYLENLSVLRKNIEYQYSNTQKTIGFEYLAAETELFPWDIHHLQRVFPMGRFAPLANHSGDTTQIASFADFMALRKPAATRYVNPQNRVSPVPNLHDGEFVFNANSEEDAVYYLGKDAAILVPKNCLRTAKDTLYHGYYSLKCHWLNTPGKLFESGANLNFDSSKLKYDLTPTGVLEIAATAGKDILDFREGYFIKVVFLGAADTAKRFYAWGKKEGKWQNFYDYDYQFDDSKIVPIDFYNFYGGKKTAKEYFGIDRSNAEWRFESEGYFYLLEPGQARVSLENFNGYWVAPITDRAPKVGAYVLKRGKSLIGLKKEFVDKKTEQGIVKFQVFDKTETLFPELKAFNNYIFEVSSAMNPRDFSAFFIRGAVYCDIRILQIGTSFVMDLRTETGIWRLNIQTPNDKFKKGSAKAKTAMNEFMRRFNKYTSIRNARERSFEQYLSTTHTNNAVAARNALFFKAANGKNIAAQEFKIRSMGTYAWASPKLLPDTFQVVVKFTDAGGIPLDVKRAWVAHNSPFGYRSFANIENYNIVIDPQKLSYIACVDFKDQLYVISGADFRLRQVSNNSLVYLAMGEFPRNVKNLKELEKILGISK